MPAEEDMLRHIFKFSILSLFVSLTVCGCSKKAGISDARAREVVVYTYDSFCGEWGPGAAVARKFEEKTGLKVTYVDCGDGVEVLSRAILEKDNVQADVILGLDNNLVQKAESQNVLSEYKAQGSDSISEELKSALGGKNLLTPFDYAPFAIIYDTKSDVPAPSCLDDLTKPVYTKKLILMNPRTSTPGLGFVAWTFVAKGGDSAKFAEYWKALKPNILTMAPGWSAGYGLFTNGEAPLVSSYTTSAAYHYEYDKTDRYQALIFNDGHVLQVEGAGVAKNAPNKKGAEMFIDFLISEEGQNELPLTQWMLPANKNVKLPQSYLDGAPVPAKYLSYAPAEIAGAVEQVMTVLGE